MWLCQHFLWDSHHLSLSVPILPPSLLPSHVLSGVRCQCRCNHLRWVAVVCQNLKDHFDSICHSGGKFDIHMPCDNSLDITASDRGTQLWTSILFFFFFCSSRLSSTTASSNVWKQLQMHLQEMYPTYRAHRVDSSWWPRWHFHRLQGCSRQTCSLSPPCKSLHEWKASLVSCGGPEYLEGTHTMVQHSRSQWKVVKVPITQTVLKWKSCCKMVGF